MECLKRKEVEKAKAKKCFLENGSKFLEALIAESNGITNPIRMFNFDQISTATNNLDTKFYLFVGDSYGWYKGVIEGRPYAIKNSQDTPEVDIYRDIVISARVSDHSGFIKLMGCCLEFPYPAAVFECPELHYIATGIVTEYCDVYSFGIFMLVLLLGIKPFTHIPDPYYMLNDVKGLLERGEVVEFGGDSNDMRPIQMKMFLDLALRCCEKENIDRPKMIVVAKELKLIESSPDC